MHAIIGKAHLMQAHHEYDYWNIKTLSLHSAYPVRAASSFDTPPTAPCDSETPHNSKNFGQERDPDKGNGLGVGVGLGSNMITSKYMVNPTPLKTRNTNAVATKAATKVVRHEQHHMSAWYFTLR